MIEQFLQVTIEFLKEVWFQLDSMFGLEQTEAFQFIKPYLVQLQDNPTFMAIALASAALIPVGLYKLRNNTRDRDRKLEELMEEMEDEEEDYDQADPRRLRRQEPSKDGTEAISKSDMKKDHEKSLSENDSEEELQFMQILEKLDEEDKTDELHVDTQKVMGTEEEGLELEPVTSELAEPVINKDLSEFEEFDLDRQDSVVEDSIPAKTSHHQTTEDLPNEDELIELDSELSQDNRFPNYLALDNEEQDRAIQELQGEMESTINKLTEELETEKESPSLAKGPLDTSIEDEVTNENNSKPESKSLSELVPEPEPLSEEHVIDKMDSEPLQPVPERDYSLHSKSGREAESLINRLKYFQENLDTKPNKEEKEGSFSPLEPSNKDLKDEPQYIEEQSFASKVPRVFPEDKEKYMEVLESFIFLKNQNNH